MNEEIIMLIWGITLLGITWLAQKTMSECKESSIFKIAALVLTIALAPLLTLLFGVWTIK